MARYKKGDEVRVTFTDLGFITDVDGDFGFDINDTYYIPVKAWGDHVTVELVEPAYDAWSVYVSASGALYYRRGSYPDGLPWRHVASGDLHVEEDPVRPLRKLVPEESA
jgi:hypothetical protein